MKSAPLAYLWVSFFSLPLIFPRLIISRRRFAPDTRGTVDFRAFWTPRKAEIREAGWIAEMMLSTLRLSSGYFFFHFLGLASGDFSHPWPALVVISCLQEYAGVGELPGTVHLPGIMPNDAGGHGVNEGPGGALEALAPIYLALCRKTRG